MTLTELHLRLSHYPKDNCNTGNIDKAHEEGIDAFTVDIYKDDLRNYADLNDVGILMAMTGSAEVNNYTLDNLSKDFGENGAYRLTSVNELQNPDSVSPDNLFSRNDDFINLLEVARDYPSISEIDVNSAEELSQMLTQINEQEKAIPLFIKRAESGESDIVLSGNNGLNLKYLEGDKLIYLGKFNHSIETV